MKIERGKKYSAQEAKAIVDQLYAKVRERWDARVNQKAFMEQLMAGKLPLKTLQMFFRNWGAYTIEINTLTACTYHRNITFLKVNRDLMGPLGEKIADVHRFAVSLCCFGIDHFRREITKRARQY